MIHRSFQLLRSPILKRDIADRARLHATAGKPFPDKPAAATPATKQQRPRPANPSN